VQNSRTAKLAEEILTKELFNLPDITNLRLIDTIVIGGLIFTIIIVTFVEKTNIVRTTSTTATSQWISNEISVDLSG